MKELAFGLVPMHLLHIHLLANQEGQQGLDSDKNIERSCRLEQNQKTVTYDDY